MTDEMRARVEKVMKNLERNKMKPYFLRKQGRGSGTCKNTH